LDGAGDELLACAAFAGDQNGRLGGRDAVHQREKLAHRGGTADDALGVPDGLVPVRVGMLGGGQRGAGKRCRVGGAVFARFEIAAQATAKHQRVGDEGRAGENETQGALRRHGSKIEGESARCRPSHDDRHGEDVFPFLRVSFHDSLRDESHSGIRLGVLGHAPRDPAAQKSLVLFGARRDEQRLVGLSAQSREAAAQADARLHELDHGRHCVGQLGMTAEEPRHLEEQRQVLGGG
jgi:hypothetical protein